MSANHPATRLLRGLPLLLVLLCGTSLRAQDTINDKGLTRDLLLSYNQWIEAVEKRDAAAWANAITKHRQVITRNTLISQGQAFPRDVWQGLPAAAPVEQLRLLESQSVGETAHLLYFGQLDGGGNKSGSSPNLILLKFFFERAAWRFDSHKIINLVSNPALREALQREGNPDFLNEAMFNPPGKAPAVPPLCALPDFITGCTVTCPGWELTLRVNDQEHYAADGILKFFIQGGLHKGENSIELEAAAIEGSGPSERDLKIDLFLKPEPGQKVQRVMHLQTLQPDETRARRGRWILSMPASQTLQIEVP